MQARALETLGAPAEYRETIKKSVFRARAAPVRDAQDALDFFATAGDPAATHNCWALRIGAVYRFNDDGEPGGSAGRPILQAIDGQGCDRVAVVVTRWFGGIKLGTGGLVRAYGGCAANCLRLAERVPIVDCVTARVYCGFAQLQWLQSRLLQAAAVITAEDYDAAGVTLHLSIPRAQARTLAEAVSNATRGQAQLLFDDSGATNGA